MGREEKQRIKGREIEKMKVSNQNQVHHRENIDSYFFFTKENIEAFKLQTVEFCKNQLCTFVVYLEVAPKNKNSSHELVNYPQCICKLTI